MPKVIYKSQVVSVGEFAAEFFEENIMVFFGKQAPAELQEHAIVLEHNRPPTKDIAVGDNIILDDHALTVTAIGPLVNENFRNLGHLVVKLNAGDTPEMDGDLNVAGEHVFNPKSGSILRIIKARKGLFKRRENVNN